MTIDMSRRTVLKALGVSGVALAGGTTTVSARRTVGELELLYEFAPPNPDENFPGELPENVAIDKQGNKYVSVSPLGQIWQFTPDNTLVEEPYAVFDVSGTFLVGTVGVEVDPQGTLYVCFASDLDPPEKQDQSSTNGVWRVEDGSDPELYAELSTGDGGPPTFPNDLIRFRDSLLVTDSFLGAVWRVREGEAEVWAQSELLSGGEDFGADGIQLSKDKQTVYVTNIAEGTIVKLPVTADGSAGEPELFVDGLTGPDGLAMDTRGNLYVADNRGNEIVRVSPDGTLETLASNDDGSGPRLDNPADVTFGTAGGEQKSLFIVNLALSETPMPSLMKLDVGVPGLPVRR
jgi:sugar lactone lactonase YvrE